MRKQTNQLEKRYRLRTGLILEVWMPPPDESEIKRIAIFSRRGALKGVLEFVVEDVQTIIDAVNEAASIAEYVFPPENDA